MSDGQGYPVAVFGSIPSGNGLRWGGGNMDAMSDAPMLNAEADALLDRIATRFATSDTLPTAFMALARAIECDDIDARAQAQFEVRAILSWPKYQEPA